jgi:hypothetical protein
MQECFLQDAPVLNDIRCQVTTPLPVSRGAWLTGAAVLLVIAAAFVVPHVVTTPAMRSVRFPSPEGWNYWQAVKDNARHVKAMVRPWVLSYGSGRAGLVLLLIGGFVAAGSERRRSVPLLSPARSDRPILRPCLWIDFPLW